MLLEENVDVNYQNNYGYTPLMKAAKDNDIKVMQKLLQHKADVNLRNNVDEDTALSFAIKNKHRSTNQLKAVEMLLNNRADINCQDRNGHTPLMLAVKDARFELVQLIFKHRGKQNAENVLDAHQKIESDLCDNEGRTVLHMAIDEHQLLSVKLLLQNGASIDIQDFKGQTPLHAAAQNDFHQAIEELLNHGADKSITTYHGDTPLDIASKNNHTKCIGLLSPEPDDPSSSAIVLPSTDVNSESALDRYLRESAKLITTDAKLIAVGLQLNFAYNEIEAIRTNNRDDIVVAGFKLLQKWKQKYFSLPTIQESLAPAFKEIELEYDFRKILHAMEDDKSADNDDDDEPESKRRKLVEASKQ